MKMRLAIALTVAGAISGCETTSTTAPPVTAGMIQSAARQQVDAAGLTSGRSLFVNRCARCHTLPVVGEQSPDDWPGIIAVMAKRSGLQPDQSKQVLAYLLAAHH